MEQTKREPLDELIYILEQNGYSILTATTSPEMYGYNDKDEKEQVATVKVFIGDKRVIRYEF